MGVETIHDRLPHSHWIQHTYIARCSCGWESEEEPSEKAADMALKVHHEENAS